MNNNFNHQGDLMLTKVKINTTRKINTRVKINTKSIKIETPENQYQENQY